MSKAFKFFDPGEGLDEAEIIEFHVSVGDSVNDGDALLTVETDKAAAEVPAPFSGRIESIEVEEGQSVRVGDVLLTYEEAGEAGGSGDDASSSAGTESAGGGGKSEAAASSSGEEASAASAESEATASSDQQSGGSSARSAAASAGNGAAAQARSDGGGRRQAARSSRRARRDTPVPAAPSTRRVAHELGVDLHEIEPSGPHGRVTREDVEAAASASEASSGQAQGPSYPLTPGLTPTPLPDLSQWGAVEQQPLRSVRRSTAVNMARAWAEIPHVFHQDVADITELERFRREHAETAQAEGGQFSLTVLVMKALTYALKRFPRFNASLDARNEQIVYKRYFHIGLAVATERGLLVPVIRDVERKSLTELTAELAGLVERTRNGDAKRAEMQGGSITLTNPGPMGGSGVSPLINPPQVAILGMARARLEATVLGDFDDYRMEPRLRLPLCLAFDHRVNDGADAARFVTTLIETLQDPQALALRI